MKQARKPNDSQFISLYDKSLLNEIKFPTEPTNICLWYKKTEPLYWGLTVKALDSTSVKNPKEPIWKISWINDEDQKLLVPTIPSKTFVDIVKGDLYDKLKDIVLSHQKRKNILV